MPKRPRSDGEDDEPQEHDSSQLIRWTFPYKQKYIECQRHGDGRDMVFTHGARGGLDASATRNFIQGFSTKASITAFEGNMNFKSRVDMFTEVMWEMAEREGDYDGEGKPTTDSLYYGTATGGRSMGARAAIEAGLVASRPMVLVSYPLISAKGEMRDELLLKLDEGHEVLFIIGDNDKMCPLEELSKVREKMEAKTWLIEVKGADHSMRKADVKKTGELAATWLKDRPEARYMLLDGDEGKWTRDTCKLDDHLRLLS